MNRRTFLGGLAAALAAPKLLTDARALPVAPGLHRLRGAGDLLVQMLGRVQHSAERAAIATRVLRRYAASLRPDDTWETP